jgi:hypothetical protein
MPIFCAKVTCKLRMGDVKHSDHSSAKRDGSMVTLFVKTRFKTREDFRKEPKRALNWLTGPAAENGIGIPLSDGQQKAFKKWFSDTKTRVNNPYGLKCKNNWSAVFKRLEHYVRDRSGEAGEFSIHAIYAVDGGGTIDEAILFEEHARNSKNEEFVRFAVLLSTENLILNQYRQTFLGRGIVYELDTSYRYSNEPIQFMPLRCRSGNHRGKAIGWALVTSDDETCFEHVLNLAKTECEQLIRERCRKGCTEV